MFVFMLHTRLRISIRLGTKWLWVRVLLEPLIIFAKCSILDVWLCSEYASSVIPWNSNIKVKNSCSGRFSKNDFTIISFTLDKIVAFLLHAYLFKVCLMVFLLLFSWLNLVKIDLQRYLDAFITFVTINIHLLSKLLNRKSFFQQQS